MRVVEGRTEFHALLATASSLSQYCSIFVTSMLSSGSKLSSRKCRAHLRMSTSNTSRACVATISANSSGVATDDVAGAHLHAA